MKTCKITIKDEINCVITGLESKDQDFLYEHFGPFKDGYRYAPAFQLRRWDGRVHFYDKSGKTYTKLLDEIIPFLIGWHYEIDLVDNRNNSLIEFNEIDKNIFNKPSVQLRDYQVNVVNALLKEGSGFFIGATGCGKSIITAAISYYYASKNIRTIIIVPSSDLVSQTLETVNLALSDLEISTGEYSGALKQIDRDIVVSTWQALQNVPHYMKMFSCVIIDECVHPDTLIDTDNGKIQIKHLKKGQNVLTLNEKTNNYEYKPILEIHKNLVKSSKEKRLEIELESGEKLIVTGNHKILTAAGWKRADELLETDIIL